MADEAKLFGKKPGIDPDYDLIMDEHLAKNEFPAAKMDAARSADHTSLCAKFCTPEVWEKYKDLKSTGPAHWTIARAINTGVMHPDSFVGCHAGDKESFDDFKDLFCPVIEACHKGFSMSIGSQLSGTAAERMDPSKIKVELNASAQSKIILTRIRVARNLASFPLNSGGSKESREEIAALMKKVYNSLSGTDLGGNFYLHTDMTDEQRQSLIDDHFLFRGKDRIQAASGCHEHWPHGRGVFLNEAKTFVNWVNESDHLRLICMQKGGDVKAVFARLSAGAKAIEDGVRKETGSEGEVFMMHPKFGSVTCCPSNIGTGLRGSVHILVPKLIKKIGFEAIDKLARERNCQARGSSGEHSEVVNRIDISNWPHIGLPEYELVENMIKCANFMAAEEDKICEETFFMPLMDVVSPSSFDKVHKLFASCSKVLRAFLKKYKEVKPMKVNISSENGDVFSVMENYSATPDVSPLPPRSSDIVRNAAAASKYLNCPVMYRPRSNQMNQAVLRVLCDSLLDAMDLRQLVALLRGFSPYKEFENAQNGAYSSIQEVMHSFRASSAEDQAVIFEKCRRHLAVLLVWLKRQESVRTQAYKSANADFEQCLATINRKQDPLYLSHDPNCPNQDIDNALGIMNRGLDLLCQLILPRTDLGQVCVDSKPDFWKKVMVDLRAHQDHDVSKHLQIVIVLRDLMTHYHEDVVRRLETPWLTAKRAFDSMKEYLDVVQTSNEQVLYEFNRIHLKLKSVVRSCSYTSSRGEQVLG